MKILIVTPYGEENYGNKFQNYALQTSLEKMGHQVLTITNEEWYSLEKYRKKSLLINLKVKIWNILYGKKTITRRKKFEKFSNKYIKKGKFSSKTMFDVVCVGSDQIWNPYFSDNFYYTYGQFADRVFSYAASFGISDIPQKYTRDVAKGLEHLKNISVREETGAEIVEKLIQKKAEVLVDPTMLLTSDEWDKISEKPMCFPKEEYMLTYFLGAYSEERRKYIREFANKNNLQIVDLGIKDVEKYYCVDPGEFIFLLKKSSYVFTDSFHGTVFSILYKKKFFVFERESASGEESKRTSMKSRLDTLLKKFKLEDRKMESYKGYPKKEIDFSEIDAILRKEREKSANYFKKVLNIEGE